MNERDDLGGDDIAGLLGTAARTFDPAPDLRSLVDRRATRRRRTQVVVPAVVTVTLVLVLTAGAVLVNGRRDVSIDTGAARAPGTTTTSAVPVEVAANPVDWNTATVALHADDLRIVAGRDTYLGDDPEATLRSDPGMPNEYTTLERIWHEHGNEMRLFLYFKSDGTDWWSDEIRTYGNADGAWYHYKGEFFRRPLGQPFEGDVTLPAQPDGSTVRMTGLRLQAFAPPAACANQTTPFVADVVYPEVRTSTDPTSSFSADVRLRDANCAVVTDTSPFRFDYTVDDPTIARITPGCAANTTPLELCRSRVELKGLAIGATTLRATVHQVSDDAVVATATMHVTVTAPDPTISPSSVPSNDAGSKGTVIRLGTTEPG